MILINIWIFIILFSHFLLSLSFDWADKQTLKTVFSPLSSAEYYVFSTLLLVSGNVMTNCQWCLIYIITSQMTAEIEKKMYLMKNPGFRVDNVSLFWFVLGKKKTVIVL